MAKLLIARGAHREPRTAEGTTVADIAVKYGHPYFAEWIRSFG